MKKVYLSVLGVVAAFTMSTAQQDTLLFQDFQDDAFTIQAAYPASILNDTEWYTYDNDGFPDANGRPQEWFFAFAFANADSISWDNDTNVVMASSSWHSTVETSDNWLVLPAVQLGSNAQLKWFSAPRQTPLYLDGYKVRISTSTNDPLDFNSGAIFTAAEFVGYNGAGSPAGDYQNYVFSPASGSFIHGWNGSAIVSAQLEYDGDSSRFFGVMTEQTVNLGAYAGQTVYIAFQHQSEDDNLISVDDILILSDNNVSVDETEFNIGLSLYPNPTVDFINLAYELSFETPIIIDITDVYGRLVRTESLGNRAAGANVARIDVSDLANGTYNVNVRTSKGNNLYSFIKN